MIEDTFPKEWFDLKEIYPEAEVYEYADYVNFESGNWDMDGLREDLNIIIERTGKKPTGKKPEKKQKDLKIEKMSIVNLRKILKIKGLPTAGTKSKLIERLKKTIEEKKSPDKKQNDLKIERMSNSNLRRVLKIKGLPTTGIKSKLIERLKKAIKEKETSDGKQTKSEETSKEKALPKKKIGKKIVKKSIRKSRNKDLIEEKTTTIECPDCSARMIIPDISGIQEVQCPECDIKGEIEL